MQGGSAAVRVMGGILKILQTLSLTLAYLLVASQKGSGLETVAVAASTDKLKLSHVFEVVFLFRAFARTFHDPLGASIESLCMLYYEDPMYLCIFAFILQRARVLFNKSVYILVSVLTALKNKKQRFENQGVCFLIQFTVLLPVTLFVLLMATLLDTALIPFLGFAFFTIGYPKPQRGWSTINPVSANPADPRSDGHLYQALLPELTL